jgi:hypothetical protein
MGLAEAKPGAATQAGLQKDVPHITHFMKSSVIFVNVSV